MSERGENQPLALNSVMTPPCEFRPLSLLCELTYRCPLHCPYCSNSIDISARNEISTPDWVRVIGQAANLGVLHVGLSGGEPLLHSGLDEIISAVRDNGLYSNLITSAVGLDYERALMLKSAGLDSVQISFQANNPTLADGIAGTKAHHLKLMAAEAIKRVGLPLTVNAVLHRRNLSDLPGIISLAERLGAVRLELANTQYYGWAFKNMHALLPTQDQLKIATELAVEAKHRLQGKMEILFVMPDYLDRRPKPCMNGWGQRYLTVNPQGFVLPCPTAYGIPDIVFDNVLETELYEIWNHSAAFNRFRGTDWMPEPCQSCPLKTVDFGGCRCQAALLTGDPAVTDPACELSPHHNLIEDILGLPKSEDWSYRRLVKSSPAEEAL